MRNASPLRYPGGKGKLAPYIIELLELNGMLGSNYAEPFAGGAGVAMELLFTERVGRIHINDIDPAVFAFWYSAVHHTDELVEKILRTEVTTSNWLAAREVKRQPSHHDVVTLGFAAFFLNRTNQSGILNGGMIGGLSQTGRYKLDCRYNKEELVYKIRRIGFYSSRISVSNLDAEAFIDSLNGMSAPCLVYIDPPYYVKGAYLYDNHYGPDDHIRLADSVRRLTHRWIVSYDNVDAIREIYIENPQEKFDIGYSARNHRFGSEVMVYSHGLKRPPRIYSSIKQKKAFLAGGNMKERRKDALPSC